MADKRKRKTEYVVSGGVDTSLTKDQPDEDDTEQNQEPPPPVENKTEQSKELPPNEKEQEINKPSELKAPEQEVKEPEKSKEISLPGGDFLKKEGSDKNPFDVRLSTPYLMVFLVFLKVRGGCSFLWILVELLTFKLA